MASVMDLCTRKIIGYAYSTSMTAQLAVEAVKNACLNVKDTQGIILHSDLGSQYTSQLFENFLISRGMVHSFSRKGNLDNDLQITDAALPTMEHDRSLRLDFDEVYVSSITLSFLPKEGQNSVSLSEIMVFGEET